MIPIFKVKFENGKIYIIDREVFNKYISGFKSGTFGELIVRKKRKPRSTGRADEEGNQNGYYRGVIVPIVAKFMGQTEEETHEDLLELYAPRVPKRVLDRVKMEVVRTSAMDTLQMKEYCDTVIRVMAGLDVIIPDPDKAYIKYQ